MRSYARRVDAETGTLHKRVSQEHEYDLELPLYERRIAGGVVHCFMVRSSQGPARRLVQLRAAYEDAGVQVTHVVQCESEVDEVNQLVRLERLIREAARRPARV